MGYAAGLRGAISAVIPVLLELFNYWHSRAAFYHARRAASLLAKLAAYRKIYSDGISN